MGKTAVVIGATGLVGSELVNALIGDRAYDRVIALVRTRADREAPKLEQRVIDFERIEELPEEWIRGSDLFCALGTTIKTAGTRERFRRVDCDYVLAFGRLAERHGAAQLLVVTAMGADSRSRVFYNRVKGEAEEALRQLALPSLTIVRPSLLLGDRAEHRPGEQAAAWAAKRMPFLFAGALRKYAPITARRVAAGMIEKAHAARGGVHIFPSDQI